MKSASDEFQILFFIIVNTTAVYDTCCLYNSTWQEWSGQQTEKEEAKFKPTVTHIYLHLGIFLISNMSLISSTTTTSLEKRVNIVLVSIVACICHKVLRWNSQPEPEAYSVVSYIYVIIAIISYWVSEQTALFFF